MDATLNQQLISFSVILNSVNQGKPSLTSFEAVNQNESLLTSSILMLMRSFLNQQLTSNHLYKQPYGYW